MNDRAQIRRSSRRLVALLVCLVLFTFARFGRAEPIRIVVAVGHRLGLAGEAPLRHATRDATRVRDVFVQLGGVHPEHALLLVDPNPGELLAALDRATAIARTHRPDEVTLVFYFSGHGDRGQLHLGSERFSLRDIDARLVAIPAALRIIVADACRTSDVAPKGVTIEAPFAVSVDGSGAANGVVRIHASADGEVAQESDELAGAVFTHYWLSGLSGAADVDSDARVTLAESYAFAYHQTLYRSARASGVLQRPAAQFDLREAAPVVLTRIATASLLRLPRASGAQYLVYGLGTRAVMGELWSSPDRSVALAVPSGTYVVQRRGGGRSAAVQVDLGPSEQRELRASDFRPMPEELLARKGGDLVVRPDELSLSYATKTSRLADIGHELSLRYARSWDGGWAISVAAAGGIGSRTRPAQSARVVSLGGDALIEQRLRAGPVLLRAGVGPRVLGVLQTLRRTDGERVARAGYDPERRFRGVNVGAHALLGARLPLGEASWLEVDGRGEVLMGDIEGRASGIWGADIGVSLGYSF